MKVAAAAELWDFHFYTKTGSDDDGDDGDDDHDDNVDDNGDDEDDDDDEKEDDVNVVNMKMKIKLRLWQMCHI